VISIILPLFGSHRTIHRCLDSINSAVAASGTPTEAVFVFDGPDPETRLVIESYPVSPLLRLSVHTQEHSGIAAARNRGVAEAAERLITFLDADDELTPERLMVARCGTHAGLAIGNQRLSNPKTVPPGSHASIIADKPIPYIMSLVCTRETLEKLEGFRCDFTLGNDWDFLLRARAHHVPIEFVNEVWVIRHVDEHNASNNTKMLSTDYLSAIRSHLHSRSDDRGS